MSDGNPAGIDRPAATRNDRGAFGDLGPEGHAVEHEPRGVGHPPTARLHDSKDRPVLGHRARTEVRMRPVHRESTPGTNLPRDTDESGSGRDRHVDHDSVAPPRVEEEHAFRPERTRAQQGGRHIGRGRAVPEREELPQSPVLFRQRALGVDQRLRGVELHLELTRFRRLQTEPLEGLLNPEEGGKHRAANRAGDALLGGPGQDHQDGREQ